MLKRVEILPSLLGTTFLLTIMNLLTDTARAGQDQDAVPVEQ